MKTGETDDLSLLTFVKLDSIMKDLKRNNWKRRGGEEILKAKKKESRIP